jgi:hypothetical protein
VGVLENLYSLVQWLKGSVGPENRATAARSRYGTIVFIQNQDKARLTVPWQFADQHSEIYFASMYYGSAYIGTGKIYGARYAAVHIEDFELVVCP